MRSAERGAAARAQRAKARHNSGGYLPARLVSQTRLVPEGRDGDGTLQTEMRKGALAAATDGSTKASMDPGNTMAL